MAPRLAYGIAFGVTLAVVIAAVPPGSDRDLALAALLAIGAGLMVIVEASRLARIRSATPRAMAGLTGRVALASYFLGRDGRAWSEAERMATRRALDRAAAWLNAEAARWGVQLSVARSPLEAAAVDDAPRSPHPLGADLQEHFEQISDTAEWVELLRAATSAAGQAGHRDLPSLVAALSADLDADHVVWFLHSLSRGQSHVLEEEHTGVPGLRLAVCYAREGTPHGPHAGPVFADPITFLHELLHLFGASDKYGGSTRRYPRGEVTGDDIMLLRHESLARLRIDPLTAREIGWLGAGPPPDPIQRRTRRAGGRRGGGSEESKPG